MSMIIDSHAHVVLPPESYKYMAELVSSRANPTFPAALTDEGVRKAGQSIVDIMDKVGTDIQFPSPRPYMQMHSVKPAKVTALWTKHINDLIFRTVKMFPKRFRAVAGLPQHRDTPHPDNCFAELDMPHGGGAIPYHMGRFRAWSLRKGEEFFDDQLKRVHFDTTTCDKDALELLFKVVGPDRVLFGTENPGTGSVTDPKTGRDYDDLKPVIESIAFLSEKDRENVFECNCARPYTHFKSYK